MFFQIIILCLAAASASVDAKSSRILGGINANRATYPFMAVLRRITDEYLIGGGAIISNKFILTAAHAVDDRHVSNANIKINTGNCNATHLFTSEYLPRRIFSHPFYTGVLDATSTPNHDIAVIEIHGFIRLNPYERYVLLPNRNIEIGQRGNVFGYGTVTHPEINMSLILQKVEMRILDPEDCRQQFPVDIYDDQFCAFHAPRVGPCIGDGGGPFVINNRVVGIYSMSYLCAAGLPDVYTNVYEHMDFINAIIRPHPSG